MFNNLLNSYIYIPTIFNHSDPRNPSLPIKVICHLFAINAEDTYTYIVVVCGEGGGPIRNKCIYAKLPSNKNYWIQWFVPYGSIMGSQFGPLGEF